MTVNVHGFRVRYGLSCAKLARALRLGKGGDRTIRRWESGDSNVPGPVQVLLELANQRPGIAAWLVEKAAKRKTLTL